jgi:small basic protein
MLTALVYLIVVGLVVGVVFWLMDYLPVPEPLNRFIKIAAILIGLIALIMILLDATGTDVGLRSVRP